jgi:putative ABC transport system permease protein
MRNKYLYKISLKNLFANRLRTYLTLGGVIIGVGSIVFLVSLGFGLQRLVTSEVATLEEMKVANVNPGDSEILRLNGEATEKISTIAGVNKVGKMINVASRANYQSSVIDTVAYGIDNEYLNLEGIKADIGRMFSSQEAEEVVANRTVLNLLGVEENQETMIDKTIKFDFIITSELLDKDSKKVVTGKELKIVGIEDNKGTPTIYLPIEFLKAQGVGYYSGLKLQSENPDQVPGIRDAVENMGYKTEYVGDTVTQIDQVFDIFKVVLAGFGSVAMVVAALGMFNTLTVSLLERIREVGLLKALGMSRADIRKLFLSEAMIIGIGGGLMGLILGLLVGYILNYSINALAIASGASPVDFFYMPWYFAVGMAIFSIIIGLLTGIYPAQRAVKINALDALRYE